MELALRLHNQMKQLLQATPVAIPDPATVINKANLMAMEHDMRLNILDKLVPTSIWGTPKYMALLMEMGIGAMAISTRNSIQVPFKLHHFKGTSQETTLLNTGAMESFIDIKTVKWLNLGSQELVIPCPVYNMDGSPNKHGTIMHTTHLLVTQGNKSNKSHSM